MRHNRCGLERLCAALGGLLPLPLEPDLVARVRQSAGLVTHPAAVTRDLTGAVDALRQAGAGLVALFGPEHGVRGEAPDGRTVPSAVDPRSGLPVHSLYAGPGSSHAPTPEMLRGIAVLLIDLQDIGARFYTFASTVSHCMKAAAAVDVPVVILDRPNPLGEVIEGPLLQPKFASFVGLHPLPIRHGCTMGELGLLFHRTFGVGHEPIVVGGSRQGEHGDETRERGPLARDISPYSDAQRHWVPPSPNIPTLLTALVYPGTALLEGTNVSEGRGTARPFEWLGAPWVNADALAERLADFRLPGAAFRPVYFIPSASKWAGETCAGVQVHVTDARVFRPVLTGVAVLAALRELWPSRFAWREASSDVAHEKRPYFIDRLAGTDRLRRDVDEGQSPAAIAAAWRADEAAFAATRSAHLSGDEVIRDA